MSMKSQCPVCRSSNTSLFSEILDMPVLIGLLWPRHDDAIACTKGDIKLSFCKSCGFIANQAFDSSLLSYTQAYDNTLHFSPLYNEYARSTALRLINRYKLFNKTIVEIGCGKGDFLLQLCDLGNNRGVGFDPSYEGRDIDAETARRISFIKDIYSEQYKKYKGDLVCSRYVFEHIENPVSFLNMLRSNIGEKQDTIVYFEVPNVYLILNKLSIWDIIYEHCSYFSPESIAYVFELCGFEVLDLNETYDDQFIGIEASPRSEKISDHFKNNGLEKLNNYVDAFVRNYNARINDWQQKLRSFEKNGKKTVIWGAGAKGVSFLNMLKIKDQIEYAVDVNPNKHGKYIPGTGQMIVPPDFLRTYCPDYLIVMNSIYKNEIQNMIDNMGIKTELLYA